MPKTQCLWSRYREWPTALLGVVLVATEAGGDMIRWLIVREMLQNAKTQGFDPDDDDDED